MENSKFADNRRSLADAFESVFQRLLEGETFDLYAADVSFLFAAVAKHLLVEVPDRKWHWYDGVVGLTASSRKRRQVEFTGEMWVGDGKTQWKEAFRAIVTDKRVTKQGIWITLWLGESRAEGNLEKDFGTTE